MPQYKKPGDPSIKIGDTVLHDNKLYKISGEKNGNWVTKTIDMSKMKKQAQDIKKFIDSTNVQSKDYRPFGQTKWDISAPKVAHEKPGTNLDKQNRSDLVKLELQADYNKYTHNAMMTSLAMFDSAIKSGQMTPDELQQIFLPLGMSAEPHKEGPAYRYFKSTGKIKGDPRNIAITLFKDINKLKSEINKKGPEFFTAWTNREVDDKIEKKLYDDYESGRINTAEYYKKLDLAAAGNDNNQNYLKVVLNRINTWKAKNSNLTSVKSITKQNANYDYELAMADLHSLNVQQVKKWRIESKWKIVDDIYNNLKDDKRIKDEFGKPIFNDKGKLQKYNMENLMIELNNSFNPNGTYNANYIPETNYSYKYGNIKEKISSLPSYGPYSDPTAPIDYAESLGLKTTGAVPARDYSPNEQMALDEGLPIFHKQSKPMAGAFSLATTYKVIPITATAFGKEIQKQFTKSIYNLYVDKDDRNVINLRTPYFEDIKNEGGGTGIGAKALTKELYLKDEKGDSPYIWGSFVADWSRFKSGLEFKINGADGGRKISFMGAGQNAYDESDKETSDTGKKLINDFIEWINKDENQTKTRSEGFGLDAYKYANDSKDNSAMTIHFPNAFLKTVLEDDKNVKGYLSETDYDLIRQNGATIIAERKDFNNELMNSTRSTLQTYVDHNNYYAYTHPSGLGSVVVEKDDQGDYDIEYNLYDPISKRILNTQNISTRFDNQLDEGFLIALQQLQQYVYNVTNMNYLEELESTKASYEKEYQEKN